ncbi:acetate kinase [Marinicaulis flavus]|uniref:Acetate kinase n=1 Tax=Hyphococcus luteus TaxID=2058213 RepID=A0A2S7KB92_9PROT|nr:acetate kinase [Marinicaulis flavus]
MILVINAGSSSIKFAAYDAASLKLRLRGAIEELRNTPAFSIHAEDAALKTAFEDFPASGDHARYTAWILYALEKIFPDDAVAIAGHRVVHGGLHYDAPAKIDDAVLEDLQSLSPLAPNHQPHNLAAIRAVAEKSPALPQIACFDTSFHRTQPRLAQLFALPRDLIDEGVLRYGFHGLSYDHIVHELPTHLDAKSRRRVIAAHLGHGASMCALQNGRSIATTMGFTALDGLVMGARCGALDPGVVIHLIRQKGMSADDVDKMLHSKSGMLGVSGISDDVRALLKSDDPKAEEALDLFAYRAAREIGSLMAALGGLDALVFTAGIGENSPDMRKRICARADWTGLKLDEGLNEQNAGRISAASSAVEVLVIPANEELVIARACKTALEER